MKKITAKQLYAALLIFEDTGEIPIFQDEIDGHILISVPVFFQILDEVNDWIADDE